MKNIMITLEKQWITKWNEKWKLLLGRPESFTVPKLLYFFPNPDTQMDWKTCSHLNTDFRQTAQQYGPTVLTVTLLRSLRLLFCTAKLKAVGNGFFFNCLNLTFRVAFVFDLLVLGKGLPGYSYATSFQRCVWKKAPWPLRQQSDRPNPAPPLPVFFYRTENMPVNCPASQPYAIRVTVFKLKCSHKLNVQ